MLKPVSYCMHGLNKLGKLHYNFFPTEPTIKKLTLICYTNLALYSLYIYIYLKCCNAVVCCHGESLPVETELDPATEVAERPAAAQDSSLVIGAGFLRLYGHELITLQELRMHIFYKGPL